jgi:hypothetical protein
MAKADRVYITPRTNTPAIDHPMMLPPRDTTGRFETLKDAEDALMEQGFKLVPDTCNWIDDAAQIDAGVYPVEEAYGVSKYRIEYRALDATPTRRRFLAVAAFASVAGAGSLAVAAMAPNDVPKAVTVPKDSGFQADPIYEDDQPDLPEYLTYDDDTTAYPAEAFAYVIGKSLGKLMKAEGMV